MDGYIEDRVNLEIERIKLLERELFWFKYETIKADDNITLVLKYHPTLNQLHEILWRADKHGLKSPRLTSGLPSPPRVASRNPKRIRNKLVRSKLKEFVCKDAGTNICGHCNCNICKTIGSRDHFESTVTKKKYRINFLFDCNSCCVVYSPIC